MTVRFSKSFELQCFRCGQMYDVAKGHICGSKKPKKEKPTTAAAPVHNVARKDCKPGGGWDYLGRCGYQSSNREEFSESINKTTCLVCLSKLKTGVEQ